MQRLIDWDTQLAKAWTGIDRLSVISEEFWLTWEWSDTQVAKDPTLHLLDEYMGE